jgi:cytochrome c556
MRQLVLLVIGLFVGGACAFMLARGLAQRDAYPRGLMNVMQHHMAELRRLERGSHCGVQDTAGHTARIADLSHDVLAAFGSSSKDDPHLADFAENLGRKADAARAGSADCAALSRTLSELGDACEACHREYR